MNVYMYIHIYIYIKSREESLEWRDRVRIRVRVTYIESREESRVEDNAEALDSLDDAAFFVVYIFWSREFFLIFSFLFF